jgi:hypothetical protein
MLQHDRDMRQTHEPHGWVATYVTRALSNPMCRVECPCGWIGWVNAEGLFDPEWVRAELLLSRLEEAKQAETVDRMMANMRTTSFEEFAAKKFT